MEVQKLLIADEVAEMLRVDKQRIYDLSRRGLLPVIRVGERQYRYSVREIEEWLRMGGSIREGERNDRY